MSLPAPPASRSPKWPSSGHKTEGFEKEEERPSAMAVSGSTKKNVAIAGMGGTLSPGAQAETEVTVYETDR